MSQGICLRAHIMRALFVVAAFSAVSVSQCAPNPTSTNTPVPSTANCTRVFPNQKIDTGFPETYLPKNYTKCADEGQTCSCEGVAILGVPTLNYWSDIVVSEGSVDCTADVFFRNLDVGQPRECWCKSNEAAHKEDYNSYEPLQVDPELLSNKTEVADGVELISVEDAVFFDEPQRFFILYIDPSKGHKVDLANHQGQLMNVPDLAATRDSIAAVNGAYHAYGNGRVGTIMQLKIDGEVIIKHSDPTDYGLIEENAEGVLGIDAGGNVKISSTLDKAAWTDLPTYVHGGPLLIINGVRQPLDTNDTQRINHGKQPRTAVCSANDGRSALIVLDGRFYDAAGMTLPNFMLLLEGLGMQSCINMDGGGSTTMWVKDMGGVINQPRDKPPPCQPGWLNATVMRKVSNAIVVL